MDATSTPAWEQGWRRGGAPPGTPPWLAGELRALEELGRRCRACALFAWLISHQPTVLFSHNKPATSNQPAVLFSQNKPAPAISHQPAEQADGW
jgi:hypothetical protein